MFAHCIKWRGERGNRVLEENLEEEEEGVHYLKGVGLLPAIVF